MLYFFLCEGDDTTEERNGDVSVFMETRSKKAELRGHAKYRRYRVGCRAFRNGRKQTKKNKKKERNGSVV